MKEQIKKTYKYCVVIPTFNNERTLKKVIDGVLDYIPCENIIIVNDGSTDSTLEILKEYSSTHQVTHPQNMGKGMALRTAFSKAHSLGFTHAISIDSDGQHFPDDIPNLIQVSNQKPDTLLIGSRDMTQDDVPSKSSFGNKFSNFWIWVETGIKMTDTQSGYRVYPIYLMPKKWYTKKFEFEIENIVRSAWKDIPVENIPIKIIYQQEERVSHFRPFKDFTRISILNTVLVFITLTYIIPRNFIHKFKKKNLRDFIREDILGSDDSPRVKSLSLALGVFFGIIPIWGFQAAVAIFLAVVLRLNKMLAFIGTKISLIPLIPVIVLVSIHIGSLVINQSLATEEMTKMEFAKNQILEYIVGSFILGAILAIIVGFSTYFLLKIFQRKSKRNEPCV